jgi:hypothetical protein
MAISMKDRRPMRVICSTLSQTTSCLVVTARLNPVSRELEDLDALARTGKASPQEQAWTPHSLIAPPDLAATPSQIDRLHRCSDFRQLEREP